MEPLSILLFFVYTYGLGYSITSFVKISNNPFEIHIMRIAFGLGVIPIIGTFLNLVGLPVHFGFFLALSLIGPSISLFNATKRKLPKIHLTKQNLFFLGALLLFSFVLFMYLKGAFAYPYLENDDSWGHAIVVKYIATEKNLADPSSDDIFLYLDPRPPGYGILMATLYQTSSSLMWTLKFFNSLLISLGVLFFYFFARKLIGSSEKALLATFIICMIPSYFTHFIWAHSYMIAMFFPAFYAFLNIRTDWKWAIPSAVMIAGILLTQETQAVKFAIMLMLLWVVVLFVKRKLNSAEIAAPVCGLLASLALWWVPIVVRAGGLSNFLASGSYGTPSPGELFVHPSIKNVYYGVLGSATRQHGLYTFSDFFTAKSQNMINVQIGIGFIICILALLGAAYLLLRLKKSSNVKFKLYSLTTLLWAVFTFLGIHGGVRWWSPIALFSFRFWILFSIPVAILAMEGIWFLFSLSKSKIARPIILIIILIGIILTSGVPKFKLNTSIWSPGGWAISEDEVRGYLWVNELPQNTAVFTFSHNYERIIGFDKQNCGWCSEDVEFRTAGFEQSADEISSWLKKQGYAYLVIDESITSKKGVAITQEKVNEISSSGLFKVSYSRGNFVVFTVL